MKTNQYLSKGIILGPKIIKGGWCDIFAVHGRSDLCAKVLVRRRWVNGERPHPNQIVRKKYGIPDFLEYEYDNYRTILRKAPLEYHPFFVGMYGVYSTLCGPRALIMDLVRDDNGALAIPLSRNRRSLDPVFLDILESLRRDVFYAHNIDHYGFEMRNVLVKDSATPVLIDFQTSRKRYPWQLWLRLQVFNRAKVSRRFREVIHKAGRHVPNGRNQ